MSTDNNSTTDVITFLDAWLAKQDCIRFAMLFGSFAMKSDSPNSDIDLAIELNTDFSADTKLTLLQSLAELTDRRIDLIDLKTVGEPLLSQIIKYGQVMKGSQQDFINLSIKNVNMMQDFTPYIERTLKARRDRWLKRG